MRPSSPAFRAVGFAVGCLMLTILLMLMVRLHLLPKGFDTVASLAFIACFMALIVAVVGSIWRFLWRSAGKSIEAGRRSI